MAPRVTWMADSKGQNRKFCMLRSRMHARTHAEFQGLGRLRSRIGRHVESRRVTPDFFCPSCSTWPSEWNSPWEVIAQMAMSSHMQATQASMILEVGLQNIAIFWSRKNPRWIRGLLPPVQIKFCKKIPSWVKKIQYQNSGPPAMSLSLSAAKFRCFQARPPSLLATFPHSAHFRRQFQVGVGYILPRLPEFCLNRWW